MIRNTTLPWWGTHNHDVPAKGAEHQIKQITRMTRLGVTSSLYLRWNRRARYLSRLMAVAVRNDAKPVPPKTITNVITCVQKAESCGPWSRRTIATTNIGWAIKPTARSVAARLKRRIMAGVLIELGTFQMPRNASKFPSEATMAKAVFRTQFRIYGEDEP